MLGQITAVLTVIITFIWISLLWAIHTEMAAAIPTFSTSPTPTIVVRDYPSLDADVRMRYRDQVRHDQLNAIFMPKLNGIFELWATGPLVLDRVLYNGRQSSLYSIQHDPSILLKYEADCEEIEAEKMHPLLLDFWYGHLAYEVGVGPPNIFVSPPAPVDNTSLIVQRFTMSRERLDECVLDGGTVRFMILRRLPTALALYELQDRFPKRTVPFQLTIRIAISLLLKLQDLHSVARVVHGDIHPGNIMVTSDGSGPRVWIIDYGRSRANLPARSKSPVNQPFDWFSNSMSHWQIEGYEWSARDDVYNAIRMLALIMNGNEYSEFEERMKKSGKEQILKWKKYGSIWFVPPDIASVNPVHRLPIPVQRKTAIKQSLGRIIKYVRSLKDVDDVVDYQNILTEFQLCLDLTDPSKHIGV